MKRALSTVLVLAMLLTAMLGIVSGAEESAPALTISGASIEFGNNVYLYVAVNYSVLGTPDGVGLKVINNVTGEERILERDTSVESTAGFPAGSVGFKLDKIAAKNMGDELTLVPMNGNNEITEAAKTYSILEYALVAENRGDAILAALVQSMIRYGAEAQKALGHTGTYDLSVDHSFVKLMGGARFADGSSKAIMKAGDAPLTATKAGAAATDVWYNSRMQTKGTGASLSVSYTEDNQSLFVTAAPSSANVKSSSFDYENLGSVPGGVWREKINGTTKWWKLDNGSTVEYTGTKPHGSGTLNPGHTYIFSDEGYFELTSHATFASEEATKGSALQYSSTTINCAFNDIANDPNAKAFTVSFTIAGGDAESYLIDYISLRYDAATLDAYTKDSKGVLKALGKGQHLSSDIEYCTADGGEYTGSLYGRVSLLSGAYKGELRTFLTADGVYDKSDPTTKLPVASSYDFDGDVRTHGEFVTVHCVFVFETADEGMRVDYYLNDNPNRVASVNIDFIERADFVSNKWYIDSMTNAEVQSFVKSVVISSGNIADNFK